MRRVTAKKSSGSGALKSRPNRDAVALASGVSSSTVSRALSNHPGIPLETQQKVKAVAKRLGYVPSQLGRAHFQGRSRRLGLVVPAAIGNRFPLVASDYFTRILAAMLEPLPKLGYTLNIISDTGLDGKELAHVVGAKSVDGLAFIGVKVGDKRFRAVARQKVPFVLINHYDPDESWLSVDCDAGPGLREACVHLIARGVKTLAFVGGPSTMINALDRARILRNLVSELGLDLLREVPGDFTRTSGVRAAELLLAAGPLPDAVLCANDRMAFGLVQEFVNHGIKVGEQIRVIGFDNLYPARLCRPALTTVENPLAEIGRCAAEMLVASIEGKAHASCVISSRLIVREST